MVSLKTLLLAGIGFNLFLVAIIIYVVNRWHIRSKEVTKLRKLQILEQGKIISAQERVLRSKDALIGEQRALIKEIRDED